MGLWSAERKWIVSPALGAPRRQTNPMGPWVICAETVSIGGPRGHLPERTQYQFRAFRFGNEWLQVRPGVPRTNPARRRLPTPRWRPRTNPMSIWVVRLTLRRNRG